MEGFVLNRKQELELKRENGTITLDELEELGNIIKEEREERGIIFLKTK